VLCNLAGDAQGERKCKRSLFSADLMRGGKKKKKEAMRLRADGMHIRYLTMDTHSWVISRQGVQEERIKKKKGGEEKKKDSRIVRSTKEART